MMTLFEKNKIIFDENDCCNLVDELENLIKQETAAYFDKLRLNVDAYAYFLADHIFLYGQKSAERILFCRANYPQFIDELTEKIKLRLEAFFGRPLTKQDTLGLIPDMAGFEREIKDMANTRIISLLCEKISHKAFRSACKAMLPFPADWLVSEAKPEKMLFEGISHGDVKQRQLVRIRALLKGTLKSLQIKTQDTLCRQVVDDVYTLWDETCEEMPQEFERQDAV